MKLDNRYKEYTEKELISFLERNNLHNNILDTPGYHKELWDLIKGEEVILELKTLNKKCKELVIRIKLEEI